MRPLLAAALLAGCAGPPGAAPSSSLSLPIWDPQGPGGVPVGPASTASPADAPGAASSGAPTAAPTGVASAGPGSGGGGSGPGAGAPADPLLPIPSAPPGMALDGAGSLVDTPEGPMMPLPADARGAVTLAAPDHVLGTIVLDGSAAVPGVHPRPFLGTPAPTGVATVRGTLGTEGAGMIVSFRSAGRSLFAGGVTDETGAFSFQVPVAGSEAGVLVAAARSESPALAMARATLVAGETLDAPALVPEPAGAPSRPAPAAPAGLQPGPARLAVLEGTGAVPDRLDVLAFTTGQVPPYAAPGFRLASVFEAAAPTREAGSEVVTEGDGAPPAFLAPPDLSDVPDVLEPDMAIGWHPVPGARLYTLTLQRVGDAVPLWEGATPIAAIRLPAALDRGLEELVLTVDAWASDEVTLYSVASLRALRLPERPATAGGRRSWAIRRGLSVLSEAAAGGS